VWCGQVSQHQRSACLRILRDEVLVQKHFLAQTVTVSVATAGDFSLDLGFSCFIWGSGFFIENPGFVRFWSNLRNVCCIIALSIQEYSSFIFIRRKIFKLNYQIFSLNYKKNYDYVIGGDLILDLIKYNSNNAITDYIKCLLSCGCVSLISKPTK